MRKDFLGRHITIVNKDIFQKVKKNSCLKEDEHDCFFCGPDEKNQKELARISAGEGWHIKVIEGANIKESSNKNDKEFSGYVEYIIETPHHYQKTHHLSYQEIKVLLKLIKDRHMEVEKKFQDGVVLISKDVTESKHGIFQIFGLNFKPHDYKLKSRNSYQADCSYCKCVEAEADSERKVYENTIFIAFCPNASVADGEVTIVSKKHLRRFADLEEIDITALAEILKKVLESVNAVYSDYSLFINSGYGDDDFHFHIEILPKTNRLKKVKTSQDIGIKFIYQSPEEATLIYKDKL
jgi:UDPglucose--hexose-1-phosphate uridylyltransferase